MHRMTHPKRKKVRFKIPSTTTSNDIETNSSEISTEHKENIVSPSSSTSTTMSNSWLSKVRNLNSKLTHIVLGKPQFDIDTQSQHSTQSATTTTSILSSESVQRHQQKQYELQQKDSTNTEENTMILKIVGGRLCSSVLRAEGIPKHLNDEGKYRWYRINRSGDMQRIEGIKSQIFHPNLDDIGSKITCQWVAFGAGYNHTTRNKLKISNFAQIGPILMDGKLEKRVNDLQTQDRNIEFRVFMPQISSFAQIITMKKNYIKVSPLSNGINAMLQDLDSNKQQSFDIHLTPNMRVLFDDNYSSQFCIVDDEGNEYAQVIAKDHIQRQLIALLIRKNLEQFPKELSPRNKYYWQFKVQQLTERNIVLQREMNEIRHKNESIMPLIEVFNAQKDVLYSATQRESKLYLQIKDSRETIRVLKHQTSDLTAERELLKQNFIKISSHLKKSLHNLDWYKKNKNKLTEIIKNLEANNMILNEKVNEYESANATLRDANIRLKQELRITTKQKDEAFNILKSDFSDPNSNTICNKNALQKYAKHDLIDMVQDLQNDLSTEHNVVQHQLQAMEDYSKEIQRLRIENAQMKDRFSTVSSSNEYQQHNMSQTDHTLTWERVTETNSRHKKREQTPKCVQLSTNNMYQTEIHQPKITSSSSSSRVSSPKSICNQSNSNSLFMSLLKAPPIRPRLAVQQTQRISQNNAQMEAQHKTVMHSVETWNVEQVYQWAKQHAFIGVQSIANQLKQHEINGSKLQQLDQITLHIFGVPSKYISQTFKMIKAL
eukprot:103580_1